MNKGVGVFLLLIFFAACIGYVYSEQTEEPLDIESIDTKESSVATTPNPENTSPTNQEPTYIPPNSDVEGRSSSDYAIYIGGDVWKYGFMTIVIVALIVSLVGLGKHGINKYCESKKTTG